MDRAQRDTVAAYEADAAAYARASRALPDSVGGALDRFAAMVGRSARVLEIGSAGGRDALALEQRGLSVRRTDVTPAFVRLQREAGHAADVLDPLTDDLTDPDPDDADEPGRPYDGVWANACLLHVDRADLPTVLTRLAAVTRPGGALFCSLKEGDGEGWSTHGSVTAPRRFVYWREPALRDVVGGAGWDLESLQCRLGSWGEQWLMAHAVRRR